MTDSYIKFANIYQNKLVLLFVFNLPLGFIAYYYLLWPGVFSSFGRLIRAA